MFRLLYTLCLIMTLLLYGASGKSCTTVDGEIGRCIKLPECTSMFEMMQTLPMPYTQTVKEYLTQSHCGFSGRVPKVCCSFEVERETFGDFSQHHNAYLLTNKTCGLSIQPRIAGGTMAHINEFPWAVLLVYDEGLHCGGSIINERYILTAAHCINRKLRRVRIGEHTISTATDCESFIGKSYCAPPLQEINVEKTIIHELYNSHKVANDIALLRLANPIDLTVANAMPICLPLYENLWRTDFTGRNMTVIGWGYTEKNKASDVLLKVAVKVITNAECKARYKADHTPGYIMSKKMCAGSAGQDSCRGDSGGPLMYIGMYNNRLCYIQQGIVSYGSWICANGTPGVYVRIVKYLQWILDHIEP